MADNWNLGGIADSKRQGIANSSYTLKNCDIHSDPGVLKCHPTMEVDGTVNLPDGEIVSIVSVTEGTSNSIASYHFGNNGNIWKRDRFGVYTLLGQITQTSNYSKITDAKEFNGDIYFTMQKRVGKITPGTSPWATLDLDVASIELDLFHPLKVVQNDLYVGHTNHIGKISPTQTTITLDAAAAVDQGGTVNRVRIPATAHGLNIGDSVLIAGTTYYNGLFIVVDKPNADEFDIESSYTAETFAATDTATVTMRNSITIDKAYVVESLGEMGRYLVIGARQVGSAVNSFTGFAKLFRWDLISNTYSSEYEIKEVSISAMIKFKGSLLLSVGMDGNLYSYDGNSAMLYRRIPGSIKGETYISKNAWASWDGQLLLGVSGSKGVYSLGSTGAQYPDVFNLPFVLATEFVNTDITCIERVTNEVDSLMEESLLVAHSIATTNYVKAISTTLATAETETLIQKLVDKNGNKVTTRPTVQYDSYPVGTSITLWVSGDRGSYISVPLEQGPDNTLRGTTVVNYREIQYKLILIPNGTSTPIIEFYG